MDVLLPTDTGRQQRLRLISQPDQALGILLREMSLEAPNHFGPQPDRFYNQKCSGNVRLKNEPTSCLSTPCLSPTGELELALLIAFALLAHSGL